MHTKPNQYESRQRSIRIHGVITSIRLENAMWEVLSDIAVESNCSTNALISRLYDELTEGRATVSNFASFLRVTCVCHLADGKWRMRQLQRAHRAGLPGGLDGDANAPVAH
jgi:predicted DNA-binding ribbon-helix-helix protein